MATIFRPPIVVRIFPLPKAGEPVLPPNRLPFIAPNPAKPFKREYDFSNSIPPRPKMAEDTLPQNRFPYINPNPSKPFKAEFDFTRLPRFPVKAVETLPPNTLPQRALPVGAQLDATRAFPPRRAADVLFPYIQPPAAATVSPFVNQIEALKAYAKGAVIDTIFPNRLPITALPVGAQIPATTGSPQKPVADLLRANLLPLLGQPMGAQLAATQAFRLRAALEQVIVNRLPLTGQSVNPLFSSLLDAQRAAQLNPVLDFPFANLLPLLTAAPVVVPVPVVSKGWIPEVRYGKGLKKKRQAREHEPREPSIRETIERILNPPKLIEATQPTAYTPTFSLTEAERAQVLQALTAVPEDQLMAFGIEGAIRTAAELVRQLEQDDEEVLLLILAMALQ